MNPFVIFGMMVWVIFTIIGWIVGVGLLFTGMEDGDGPTAVTGLGVWMGAMLSTSFLLSMLG